MEISCKQTSHTAGTLQQAATVFHWDICFGENTLGESTIYAHHEVLQL